MTHKSALERAKEKVKEQISNAEQHKRVLEFEKQEERRILAQQLADKKAAKKAEMKRKLETFVKNISATKQESLKAQIESDFLYAKNESLHLTVGLSLAIMVIVYLFLL